VCENPPVVEAAADALGAACPPLVCTDGVPTAAVLELLDRLVASGCDLWVRADFDAAGQTIVETVRRKANGSGGDRRSRFAQESGDHAGTG